MSNVTLQGSSLSPGFTVNDLERSITFYVDGLGFELVSRNEVDGVLRWVVLKTGTAELVLGQDDFKKGKDRVKGTALRIRIDTPQDLQPLADQVKAAGFKLDSDVAPLPWGPLSFSVTDPDGFMLSISNPG